MTKKKQIPNKFKDKKFSFIEELIDSFDQDRNIDVFPENVVFDRKEQDEEVLMISRKHWIAYIGHILLALFIPIVSIVLLVISSSTQGLYGKPTVYLGLFIASLVIGINVIITAIIQWYYNISIITDKRILSLKVTSIFHHSYTEILWKKIQDVSHDSIGPLSSIFDIGNVYIDTAGEGVDLTLRFVPKPRDVQEVINNLVDLANNGDL
jgi:membrane protein YdbS with pleckstrin-like domain